MNNRWHTFVILVHRIGRTGHIAAVGLQLHTWLDTLHEVYLGGTSLDSYLKKIQVLISSSAEKIGALDQNNVLCHS